jgi:hypothetical protein
LAQKELEIRALFDFMKYFLLIHRRRRFQLYALFFVLYAFKKAVAFLISSADF